MTAHTKTPATPELPRDVEVEQALLGAILVNNDAFDRVSDIVEPRHFSEPLHQRIYDACARLIRKNQLASPATLRSHFAHDAGMAEIGGTDYLANLAGFVPSVVNAADFATMMRDLFLRRELIKASEEIKATAFDPPIDMSPGQQVDQAERLLFGIGNVASQQAGAMVETAAAIAERVVVDVDVAYREPQGVGVSTGLEAVDIVAGGLMPGDLVVLGGATSMGKTALAQQIGWNVANGIAGRHMAEAYQRRVVAFSQEMSAKQYVARHIAQISGVSTERMESGRISELEMTAIIEAQQNFQNLPLYVDGSRRLTVPQMRTRARRLIRKQGPVSLMIVDHLRFVRPDDPRANELEQIQQITSDLRALAGELGVCLLLISHLNRENWKRQDKRPILSDLYGASAIEQNADVVMFVYRASYYLKFEEPPEQDDSKAYVAWLDKKTKAEGKAEIIVAKRRRGRTGSATVLFDEDLTRFSDLQSAAKTNQQDQGSLI
ncbi:MAG: AAA family ATPase [Alphaproteobacteria bacterium]|nr:AAA family ATPase [Alphaproteobacteria bacterium]